MENLIKSLGSFDTEREVEIIVENGAERITELMQDQLSAGIDSTGQQRNDSYEAFTIRYKEEFGQGLGAVTDHVTFFMTGENYNALETKVTGGQYEITSKILGGVGSKFEKMVARITPQLFGLDPQSKEDFRDNIVIPHFSQVLQQQTGLIVSI